MLVDLVCFLNTNKNIFKDRKKSILFSSFKILTKKIIEKEQKVRE
jgi:hypothetical protein